MITNTVDLASQIRGARERLNLSQSEAAQKWDIPLKTLQNWEQGRSFPRGKTLQRLWPILFPSAHGSSTSTRKGSES